MLVQRPGSGDLQVNRYATWGMSVVDDLVRMELVGLLATQAVLD